MARVCPNCGTEAAEVDRFCSSCGTQLSAGEGAERKLATMVFVDLVGSTEMSAGADPEELRGRLEPFFEVARSSLREHGGTIEKYIGDAVLAVFGVPQAHGDDPDRAMAAALDLAQRVEELGHGLAVRIGIESGEVLARDGTGDLSVTGEPVNAAARLQQAARPGEVLVGERAARYCRRARLKPDREIEAKGMPAPVRTWRALAVREQAEAPETPLLGRDDDLDLLRLVYRRCVRERGPELILITGEAGIGKSRLAGELLRELRALPDSPRILLGRNPPYGRGIAFWALAEILRDAAAAGPDTPVNEVEEAIAELLRQLGADDSSQIASTLSVVLGSGDGEESEVSEEELRRSWRRFVALLAEDRPLVLGIDDAHWADDGLLDLLEEAAFRVQSAPLLLLCTARPELIERRPGFGRATGNVTQIELRPLNPEAATSLIEMLVPAAARELAPRAAAASGGNPFFAEEVARGIVEEPQAALQKRLPDTVQAAIAARIDLLPANEKCALQYASILGHSFGAGSLADLLGEGAGDPLAALERRALVQEQAAADGHYRFRHQLIRDVAYDSLPRSERATLHERAVDGIRERAGDRHAELAELIAFHLSRAAALQPSDERAQTAREAMVDAAEVAVRRGATARGQELYEQVAAETPDDRERVAPLRAAAQIALRRSRGDEALRLQKEAAHTAERAGDEAEAGIAYAEAVEIAARMAGVTGELPRRELEELMERGRALADPEDPMTQALLVIDEAWVAWIAGQEAEMAIASRRALERARATEDIGLISSALDAVAASCWNEGRQRESVVHTRERLELLDAAASSPRDVVVRQRGSHALEVERSDARHMLKEALLNIGDFRGAYDWGLAVRAIDLERGVDYIAWERVLLPAFYLGRWDEAVEMGERFREGWTAAGGPPVAAYAGPIAAVGAIHGYRGDEDAATDWFEFAKGISPSLAGQRPGLVIWRADIHLHRGRATAAAAVTAEEDTGFWWRGIFESTRAEAFVRAERPEARAMIAAADEVVGEHLYAEALLLRAKGLHAGEETLQRRALAMFERMECPFQAARTRWSLGEEERERAADVFERLGALPPG